MTADEILELASRDGTFAAIERLAKLPDPLAVLTLYAEAVNDAYWKRKDLHMTVMLALAGIQHGLAAALQAPDADVAGKLRNKAKAMAYNLASFTWPGWDEPGIACEPAMVAIGYEAARLNLRLAHELNKGDLPISRGLWMLAGHEICRRQFARARELFGEGAEHGKAAGSAADEALGHAFAALAELLDKPDDPARRSRLDELKAVLAKVEEGPAFVQQVESAEKVFLNRV